MIMKSKNLKQEEAKKQIKQCRLTKNLFHLQNIKKSIIKKFINNLNINLTLIKDKPFKRHLPITKNIL